MAGQRNSYGKRFHSESYYDGGGKKMRIVASNREQFSIDKEDTVFRYLCPIRRIGSIIGRGGEIVKQLRLDTKAKIRIREVVRGSEERVVTIYSPSDESNIIEDSGDLISPAQDAFFRVHDKIIAEEVHSDDESEKGHQVTARLLVPSNQIGCIIGKGGQIVQNIRSDTGAQIRILKDEHLPTCALNSDELVHVFLLNISQLVQVNIQSEKEKIKYDLVACTTMWNDRPRNDENGNQEDNNENNEEQMDGENEEGYDDNNEV